MRPIHPVVAALVQSPISVREARSLWFLARIIIDIGAEVEDENGAKPMVLDQLGSAKFIPVSERCPL